jgi:hypothetical protein
MAGCAGLIKTAVKAAETIFNEGLSRLWRTIWSAMTERFGTRWAISSWIYSREWHGRRLHRKTNYRNVRPERFAGLSTNYRADVTDPEGGFLPGVLQVGVDDRSLELQIKLEPGWQGRLVLIPEYEPKLLLSHRQGCRLEVITSIGTSHAVSTAPLVSKISSDAQPSSSPRASLLRLGRCEEHEAQPCRL